MKFARGHDAGARRSKNAERERASRPHDVVEERVVCLCPREQVLSPDEQRVRALRFCRWIGFPWWRSFTLPVSLENG